MQIFLVSLLPVLLLFKLIKYADLKLAASDFFLFIFSLSVFHLYFNSNTPKTKHHYNICVFILIETKTTFQSPEFSTDLTQNE